MDESIVTDAVLSLIPGWYHSDGGKLRLKLEIGENPETFFVVRELTPDMWTLKKYAESNSALFKGFVKNLPRPVAIDLIQEYLALKWLDLTHPDIEWRKVLAYFRELSERTYENATVTKNLIVTSNQDGNHDITQSRHAKIFDVLSSSPNCFIKVDKELRFVGYDEIKWESIKDTEDYKFHPEFLQPFHSALQDREISIHLTLRRDLIVLGRGGIIATKRKNRWKIYDSNNLKNCLGDILCGNYRVGCNMYEVLFDLSFRRHGALLIFDPLNKLSGQVVTRTHGSNRMFTKQTLLILFCEIGFAR